MPTASGIYSNGTCQGCRHGPGFPTEASSNGLRSWPGSPVLPAFDQSCQRTALGSHSTFSLDRLNGTECCIIKVDRSTRRLTDTGWRKLGALWHCRHIFPTLVVCSFGAPILVYVRLLAQHASHGDKNCCPMSRIQCATLDEVT